MAKTIEQRLERVQTAIEEIESGGSSPSAGQEIEINGRTVVRPDLRTLYREEKRLLRAKRRKDRGGVRVRRGVALDD